MHSTRLSLVAAKSIKSLVENPTIGQNVTVNGWIRSVRRQKRVAFADVSDGTSSTNLAVVMSPDQSKSLSTGACVQISGRISESPGNQQFELQVEEENDRIREGIKIFGQADPASYPLQKKFHTPEYLRSLPSLRWKTVQNSSILRYRSYAQSRIGLFFESLHFTQVNSPIITSSDCEGAGEVFTVSNIENDDGNISKQQDQKHFFGDKPAYLSVSSQLHLEVFAAALSRVWNMAPAFRAEKSDTNRHLSEFWMVEAELAFTESLEDVMTVAEQMIRAAVPDRHMKKDLLDSSKQSQNHNQNQNQNQNQNSEKARHDLIVERWSMLSSSEAWPRITYTEAIDLLQKSLKEVDQQQRKPTYSNLVWGDSLSSEHEKYLAGQIFKGPVFVTDYPSSLKPFYMKLNKSTDTDINKQTVACFDLLVPDLGELIGGSLREDNYEILLDSMKSHNMNIEDLNWYLDLRKYGSFPHGGYGLGFERLVCFVCGVENIREAIGFPRWAGTCMC